MFSYSEIKNNWDFLTAEFCQIIYNYCLDNKLSSISMGKIFQLATGKYNDEMVMRCIAILTTSKYYILSHSLKYIEDGYILTPEESSLVVNKNEFIHPITKENIINPASKVIVYFDINLNNGDHV